MLYQTAQTIRDAIIRGEESCESVLTKYFEHIDRHNSKLNAIVIDMRDRAFQRAKELDKAQTEGKPLGSLHGVPISIKEAFNIAGFKTTVNFPPLKNNVAEKTSILVERLEAEGALVVGKTNIPLLLSDSQTFGPLYPTCNNPYDTSRIPGGSTGGGAATVAAGMSCFELGSDIGGSIRNPSHFCGLFGLKPTFNGHVHDGHVPPLPKNKIGFTAMNCTGPLARTVEDLSLAYKTCYEADWSHLQYLPVNSPRTSHSELSSYKIAWYDEIGPLKVNQNTKDVMAKTLSALKDKGATVEKIKLDPDWCQEIYQIWAIMFGLTAGQDFNWGIRQLMKLKFKADNKGSKVNVGKALSQGLNLNFRAFSEALLKLKEYTAQFNRYFEEYDLILSPTSAGEAFQHNPKHKKMLMDDEQVHYLDYVFGFVMPYNAMGNPVLVVPCQQDPDKLPIGLQCIGPHYSEDALLAFGKQMEDLGFKFRPPQL